MRSKLFFIFVEQNKRILRKLYFIMMSMSIIYLLSFTYSYSSWHSEFHSEGRYPQLIMNT